MQFSDERAIVILLVGATAGLLTSKLVRCTGLGMIGDGAVGIVGAIEAIVVVLIVRTSGATQWSTGRRTNPRQFHSRPPVF